MEKSLQRSVLLVTLSLFFFSIPVSLSVPFVFFHGILGGCSDDQMINLTKLFNSYSSSPGSCVEIGNGKLDSFGMPLTQQVSIACEKVKKMKELSEGYNIVAVSQGNLVARGLIEFCDNAPPVFNYVSLGGPHAGVAAFPDWCNTPFCLLLKAYFSKVYNDDVQEDLAPSENNRVFGTLQVFAKAQQRETWREELHLQRPFTSLHNLVLIMFEKDDVLIPKESSWFGYYPDGDSTTILPPQKTKLYTEDWIGLKTLDAAGKLKFLSLPGAHIQITDDEVVEYVVPCLQNEYTLSSQHEAM